MMDVRGGGGHFGAIRNEISLCSSSIPFSALYVSKVLLSYVMRGCGDVLALLDKYLFNNMLLHLICACPTYVPLLLPMTLGFLCQVSPHFWG